MIVGVVLPKEKIKNLGLYSLPQQPEGHQIKIVLIDPTIPLDQQEKCDCIIHKIHDYYVEVLNIREHESVIKGINQFCLRASALGTTLLDPWETVQHMTIRSQIADISRKCDFEMKGIQMRSPPMVEILESLSDDQFLQIMAKNHIEFPFLVKPKGGILPKFRYEMSLHFCPNSPGFSSIVDQFKQYLPCSIQQFYNHGGILYKLFILGDEWYIVPRPSIVDLNFDSKQPIYFKSSSISKNLGTCTITSSIDISKIPCGPAAGLDVDVINEFIRRLHTQMEFNLIGVDIIVDRATGSYTVIDVNYLPGYRGVPDLSSKFAKLFLRYAK